MRFMIIVRATPDSERGVIPSEHMFAEMANYHEELKKAGILLDASGPNRVPRVGAFSTWGESASWSMAPLLR